MAKPTDSDTPKFVMEASSGAWPPDELVHYEQTVTTLIDAIGLAAFERARAEGYSMATSEAVEFALKIRSSA